MLFMLNLERFLFFKVKCELTYFLSVVMDNNPEVCCVGPVCRRDGLSSWHFFMLFLCSVKVLIRMNVE